MESWKRVMLLLGVLATMLEMGHGFFLPSSWTQGWSNQNPNTARKPDVSKQGWQPAYNFREYPYYQQHYTYDAPPPMPVAVPYPVAIPSQAPQQVALPVPQPPPVVAASIHSAVQNMQLVPCLCSVPKEAVEEDPSAHVVQTSQQMQTA